MTDDTPLFGSGFGGSDDAAEAKRGWRQAMRQRRGALTPDVRAAAASDLASHLAVLDLGEVVAAYVPVGSEPGSLEMVDALSGRVLLPVTPREPGPLDWAYYRPGELRSGRFGLLEPAGELLGAGAVAAASTILLPALAVSRRGVRLGKGAGFYDRSARGSARLVAVIYDHELVDELPSEATDVPVHGVLTPSAGLVWLT